MNATKCKERDVKDVHLLLLGSVNRLLDEAERVRELRDEMHRLLRAELKREGEPCESK